jgi:hypothetical protein
MSKTNDIKKGRDPWAVGAAIMLGLFAIASVGAGIAGDSVRPGLIAGAVFALWAVGIASESKTETARVVGGGDEREETIDILALAIGYGAIIVYASAWLTIALARGSGYEAPSLVLGVGALSYLAGVAVLRRAM